MMIICRDGGGFDNLIVHDQDSEEETYTSEKQ